MSSLVAAWTWLKVNVAELAKEPAWWEAPAAPSPMWWGELLEPPFAPEEE